MRDLNTVEWAVINETLDRALAVTATRFNAERRKTMTAPTQVRRLSGTFRDLMDAINKKADALADKVRAEGEGMMGTLAEGEALHRELRDAHDELKGTLGLSTNGGPGGPLPQ